MHCWTPRRTRRRETRAIGVFVFLPLVPPLTAWPVARLAEHHLHPRATTWLLSAVAAVLALCSTWCLGLLMVVGTAQLPGNPLPDGWSDPEVRAAVPYDEVADRIASPALVAVLLACTGTAWRHLRVRRRAERALSGLPGSPVAVLPDPAPYAYALPGRRDRIVVTTGMLAGLNAGERRALFAHERAHLAPRHHRFLLAVQLTARANPFLRPLRTAVVYSTERWSRRGGGAGRGEPADRGAGGRQVGTDLAGFTRTHAGALRRRRRAGAAPGGGPARAGSVSADLARRRSRPSGRPPGGLPRGRPSRHCPPRTRP